MTYLLLSLRRCFRGVYYPILLVILCAVLVLVPRLTAEGDALPVGLCDLDGSSTTERIAAALSEYGFVSVPDEETLRLGVAVGELNCGAVLPRGFEEMVRRNDVDGAVLFVTSPTSYAPETARNHLTAAIFAELAPVVSSMAMADSSVTADAVIAKYREIADGGARFTFRVETASGEPLREETDGLSYTVGAASLFIFAMVMHSVCHVMERDMKPLGGRIGRTRAFLCAVLPDLGVRFAGILLAVLVSALLTGDGTLLLPSVLYTLLTGAWGLLAAGVLRDCGRMRIVTLFMLLAAVVLCPIPVDVSLFFPWVGVLRILCPPCWLWLFV